MSEDEPHGEVHGPPSPEAAGEQKRPPRLPVKWTKSDLLVFGLLAVGTSEMLAGVSMDSGPIVGAAGLTLAADVVVGSVKLVRTINAAAPSPPPAG